MFFFIGPVLAQGLKIGQEMPEVTFKRLINTNKTKISLNNLKGKSVILYTWAVYCAPCIEKFPKLNELRDKNRDDLEIIMISFDPYDRVQRIFDRQQKIGRNITLAQAVLDEEEWKALSLSKADGYGSSIWIDKNGIYQGSAEIDNENVRHFITHGKPKNLKFENYAEVVKDFTPVDEKTRMENFSKLKDYNSDQPLLFAPQLEGIRSGSIFTGYNPNYPDKLPLVVVYKDNKPIGLRLVNALHTLVYRYANSTDYIIDKTNGVLTSKKSRVIKYAFNDPMSKTNYRTTMFNMDSLLIAKGICYELILPEESEKDIPTLLNYMRADLDRYFGFISTIEQKKNLALVRIADNDFRAKSTQSSTERDNYGVSVKKGSINYLTTAIYYFLDRANKDKYAEVIDQTDIDYPIDIEIVADMKNLTSVKSVLQSIGLDLIETGPQGEVCVIRD